MGDNGKIHLRLVNFEANLPMQKSEKDISMQGNLLTLQQLEQMESEIKEKQKITDHEIREFPVSVIVSMFTDGLEEDDAELYIPDYQREFIWDVKRQSRFIESLLLDLPIPYLFVADTNAKDDGRLEIVDGSQRIRTLVNFLHGDLELTGLKKIPSANGLRYTDLPKSRQLRFNRKTIRMIELTEKADEEARREIFDRLNSGGVHLNYMERRYGSSDSPFYTFLMRIEQEYAPRDETTTLFKKLCPLTSSRIQRAEYAELLLRFFAYSNNYQNFEHRVDDFLERYAERSDHDFEQMENELNRVLDYVDKTFGKRGFKKRESDNSVPRIRFEALAVGTALALRENLDLNTEQDLSWVDSQEFITHTRSDASNSKPKVIARIEYVRDQLLGRVE